MAALAEMTKQRTEDSERKCLATGERAPKSGLVRFVVSPDGIVTPDLAERLPGRGLWLSANRAVFSDVIKRKLFARAAKADVTVSANLDEQVEQLLVKKCQDTIGLAKRSDLLTIGFDRVLECLGRGRAGIVVISADAGGGKHEVIAEAGNRTVVGGLTSEEMGAPSGKGVVSFMFIERGGLAKAMQRDCERLAGFRSVEMDVSK